MTKSKMTELAKLLLFEPKEEVFQMLEKEHENIKSHLELLSKFDLDNIEPMTHINSELISFDLLRDDIVGTTIEKENILNNAKKHDNDFVTMKRVVNE
ncbi:Asp-tRNA(Asn)/Glu-tRNA(Gln) amidotransferase subunit GatC [Mycoplasma phocoenae]|uniref:Glutamyl-tRNA amidotransferase n=1 Tax=Mycoplasma phocoenae TaxID=754517 RepID=A0A858U4I4_9MOLU|nr:Asp-tRNA(Asn)/Glu-tRNA(Gln) amidotransferase subunit GatC [Mycoplasma phocoenae]QJG66989.1 glutamyl-tRNA amidotransferase [Mycoplasma phocoenae]